MEIERVRRGGTLIGRGRLHTSRPLSDMTSVVIYYHTGRGTLWAMPSDEFEDGRFEPITQEEQGMQFDPVKDIEDFHKKFGLIYDGKPRELPSAISDFRTDFLYEEVDEYAHINAPLHDKLDALVDLVYVALGTSYLHGFDFREAWRRVHASNMAKVRALTPSDSKRGSVYDVVKPPDWTPPDLTDLVRGD